MAAAADVMEINSSIAAKILEHYDGTIQKIQRETGAKIEILLVEDSELQDRKVKISGPWFAQRKAFHMIVEFVDHKIKTDFQKPISRPTIIDYDFNKLITDVWHNMASEKKLKLKREESYPVIKKNFYVEHPDITALSSIEVRAFSHRKNRILLDGGISSRLTPKPVKTFEHAFHAFPEIIEVINKHGVIEPTPIQCQAWPIILSGLDMIAVSEARSGKTLAYILPALIHLLRQPVERHLRIGPSVVVLGSTSELVQKIETETKKYVFNNIYVMSVYDGVDMKALAKTLDNVIPDILIATPSSLEDLISASTVKLEHVSYLVLDEVDCMLNSGFKSQIDLAMRHVRSNKQTILTTNTWPDKLKELIKFYASYPVHVTVGSLNLNIGMNVRQQVLTFKGNEKELWLDNYLERKFPKNYKLIIFMRKKISVDKLYSKLQQKHVKCRCLNGGRLLADLAATLSDISDGIVPIMIATDVSTRGLDIKDLDMIINYDFPVSVEEYVHRLGWTGGAGKKGDTITLFTDLDKEYANALVDVLEQTNQMVDPELYMMINKNPLLCQLPN